jgi:hypothetical protein
VKFGRKIYYKKSFKLISRVVCAIKKSKKLRKKELNEQALYHHFIRGGDSKFIAKRKAKILLKKSR